MSGFPKSLSEKSSSLPASSAQATSDWSFWGVVQDPLHLVVNQVARPTGGRSREDTGLTRHGEDEGTLCDLEACSGAESC